MAIGLRKWISVLLVLSTLLSIRGHTLAQNRMIDDAAKAVVQLVDEDTGDIGSGVIVSADGLILTSAHIMGFDDNAILQVRIFTNYNSPPRTSYYARVVELDESSDYALLEIYADAQRNSISTRSLNLPYVSGWADSANIGDVVWLLGYPGSTGQLMTVTDGTVAAIQGSGQNRVYFTTAEISQGASGGLLLTNQGALLGIGREMAGDFAQYTTILPAEAICRITDEADVEDMCNSSPPPPPPPTTGNCRPAPRLTIGERGYVLSDPPLANLLRSGPGKSGTQVVGRIEPGDSFTVLEGPVCTEGTYWWRVRNNGGVSGWTPEGDGSSAYWIAPFSGTNSACPGADNPRFSIGDTVQVDFNHGDALILTYSPQGTNPINESDTVTRAYDNERLRILDGPVCGISGNRWRWLVENSSGVTGWASEGVPGDYWMCPLSNPECGN